MNANIRRRASEIAESMANGTNIYSGQPIADTIVKVLSKQVAFTPSGLKQLEAYAKKLTAKYGE
jgi:hypothetical protein